MEQITHQQEPKLYTQEQLDIKLLQSKTDDIGQTLGRMEKRIESIESYIKSQYGNFTNYILGIYGIILCSVLAHLKGLF